MPGGPREPEEGCDRDRILADALQGGLFAGLPVKVRIPADFLDLVVVGLLIALLGFRWRLMFALGLELVPGAQLFPSWTAFLISLPTVEGETKRLSSHS